MNSVIPPAPPSGLDRVLSYARRVSLGALGLSLVIHAVGWLIAAMVIVGGGHNGSGEGSGSPALVEMAVVTEGELTKLEDQAMGVQTPAVPESSMKDVEVAVNIPDAGPTDPTGRGGDEMSDVGPMAGGGDIAIGGGDGSGLGGSGGGGASFFGVEAQGNRFAYLVDISGSMSSRLAADEGTRIDVLRAELTRSTQGLSENSQFVIFTFSSGTDVLGEKNKWTEASPANKKAFKNLIQALQPAGGTEPMGGFRMIFEMRPHPDAIYFMTDGEFDQSVVEEVALLNKKLRIPIHCICLGSKEGEDGMKRIAKGSKGTFTFVGGKP